MKNKRSFAVNISLGIIFTVLVVLPLVKMFLYMDVQTIKETITSDTFKTSLINSLSVSGTATAISVFIAYLLANSIERCNIRFKSVYRVLLVLPMLVPSLSQGMGLKLLLGNNGVVNSLLGTNFNVYGFWGIVIGSVMYSFPVAFLMISDILKYEDYSPYEAAEVLGLNKWHKFKSISFPYLRKSFISVIFAVFAMIITDYGVPLFIGGKYSTMPVVIYEEVIGQLKYPLGSVYGTVLLFPAVVAFILDLMNRDKGNSSYVAKKFLPSDSKLSKTFSYLWCSLVSVIVLIPIISFFAIGFTKNYPIDQSFTFDKLTKVFHADAGSFLLNSVVIAVLVAVIGVMVSFATAYMTARLSSPASRFLHLMAMLSAAVPGIVLGLSYVIVYSRSPISDTIVILVMVNIVHFISSPYLMIYNTLCKLNGNLENVGLTLGISRIRIIKDVIIPQTVPTILEMASYLFINSMMTISAVSFLASTSTKPLSLMINQYREFDLECAAIITIIIFLVNLLLKLIIYLFKYTYKKGQSHDTHKETI